MAASSQRAHIFVHWLLLIKSGVRAAPQALQGPGLGPEAAHLKGDASRTVRIWTSRDACCGSASLRMPAVPNRNTGVLLRRRLGTTAAAQSSSGPSAFSWTAAQGHGAGSGLQALVCVLARIGHPCQGRGAQQQPWKWANCHARDSRLLAGRPGAWIWRVQQGGRAVFRTGPPQASSCIAVSATRSKQV